MKVEHQLTAKDAKTLSGLTSEEEIVNALEVVYLAIRHRCMVCKGTDRPRRIIVRVGLLYKESESKPDKWKRAVKALTDRGFQVNSYYGDGHFSDNGVVISWQ
jgi:hypothetical protein